MRYPARRRVERPREWKKWWTRRLIIARRSGQSFFAIWGNVELKFTIIEVEPGFLALEVSLPPFRRTVLVTAELHDGKARLLFSAPRRVKILREEIHPQTNKAA